jgi:DNA invertase Pin-like site-specific DNA recombinase
MSKAYGYRRCSTGQQAESGLGLEAQTAAIEEAAKRLSLDLAGIFTDAGLSGGLPLAERPALLDVVNLLEPGDTLLVARRDRLGRDVVNVALVEREVSKRGAKIMSAAGEGSELEGPTGALVRTILDAVSQHEKSTIALRTRLALRAKLARGERLGNAPFGFRPGAGGQLEPEPREAEIVALIRELREQGLTERGIAAELRERGTVGRTGRPLGHVQVHRVLRAAA